MRQEDICCSIPEKEPTFRRTVFFEAVFPDLGRATVICECGARQSLYTEPCTNARGRPRKTITIRALVDEWCAEHFTMRHGGRTDWQLREKPHTTPGAEKESNQ